MRLSGSCGSSGSQTQNFFILIFAFEFFVLVFCIAQSDSGNSARGHVAVFVSWTWGTLHILEARDATDKSLEVLWDDAFG